MAEFNVHGRLSVPSSIKDMFQCILSRACSLNNDILSEAVICADILQVDCDQAKKALYRDFLIGENNKKTTVYPVRKNWVRHNRLVFICAFLGWS